MKLHFHNYATAEWAHGRYRWVVTYSTRKDLIGFSFGDEKHKDNPKLWRFELPDGGFVTGIIYGNYTGDEPVVDMKSLDGEDYSLFDSDKLTILKQAS